MSYRCALTLSQFSRPHSSACGIEEHRDILAALRRADAAQARALARSHLEQVSARAQFRDGGQSAYSHLDALEPYAIGVRETG
ncbi:FCD domain-containing protein [Yangia mangrovi]|uniref:FCD domain-containing protein n=1 Tax=Alloyangia mangrovi TaxID=1779329 RepID=A0A2A3JZN6_9RHOB|nr:FCD domain-containing protein [Alloyangia mangrovi]MCT4372060.1 FCD domain-containing protein [Alloyangia mangrovi]